MNYILNVNMCLTLKNDSVLPPASTPYLILFCFAKSSTLSMLASILTIVKKAAMLAVYEEMTINAKNHQNPAVTRVGIPLLNIRKMLNIHFEWDYTFSYFGSMSHPCCIIEPAVNQMQLCMFQTFSSSTGFSSHGWGFSQSAVEILHFRVTSVLFNIHF